MGSSDTELKSHYEWLGLVQPVGLVVSAPALAAAQAWVNRQVVGVQQALQRCVRREPVGGAERLVLEDFPRFCQEVLGWRAEDLAGGPGGPPLPPTLEVALPEYGDVLAPTYAVPDPEAAGRWLLLIQVVPPGTPLDEEAEAAGRGWRASPQARLERLLREQDTPIGLLSNGEAVRLVYAPRGESSGHLTFPVRPMCEVSGRPMLGALHMLLSEERLFTLPTAQRLPALLRESRRYQSVVSTKLAEQVLTALHELLRGFQAADEARGGTLLGDVVRQAPEQVYGGLLGTLMRLVFLLYAEDQGLMPASTAYAQYYSVSGLYEQLREDAARWPDTMDQRYGAWARLLTLFRLVHDGGGHGDMYLPARKGRLFDPDAWPFLEGRPWGSHRQKGAALEVPRVADGVVYRVLSNLVLLDSERLSYRGLDVEQIGSVYEAMMGFTLQRATGRSAALGRQRVVVDLEELLRRKGAERAKYLKEAADVEVTGKAQEALKAARTPEEAFEALGRKVSAAMPYLLPPGALYLQPTEERRRSGSHYTPRSLTEPIVRTTLRPVLEALGERPRPEQILDLKVCDPAMGSGAFLVAACRELAERLVAAWQAHGQVPVIPPDEDLRLHARRLVAQRCLYGVDRNPFAVDLAKLSLWLVTLAREHPFTFLDHALREGDSLVGLTRQQIQSFHWAPEQQIPLIEGRLREAIQRAEALRLRIHAMGDSDDTEEKKQLLRDADEALEDVRFVGNAVVDAFFGEDKDKAREARRYRHLDALGPWLSGQRERPRLELSGLEGEEGPVVKPFHWELEFPEVFQRQSPGFDMFVGNPPFAGKNTITAGNRDSYLPWLQVLHEGSHGNADLVAHFFRRTFEKLRRGGTFGLIATNTVSQGDTRATGLQWICTHSGNIYEARKRMRWPGKAAVVVSVVHVIKDAVTRTCHLDDRPVGRITAFLFHEGGHENPACLRENSGLGFIGSYVLGMGFTFDDTDKKGQASPLSVMHRLISKNPRNADRIFPYLGGEELNESPTHTHHRHVINFGEMSEQEAWQWPDLMEIVKQKVYPERIAQSDKIPKEKWWLFSRPRIELSRAIHNLQRVLVISRIGQACAFTLVPTGPVFSEQTVVFALPHHSSFAALQSRVHEVWARFFSSSMKDDLRYTPSDCFETFPFPPGWRDPESPLEAVGREYYEYRARLMVENDEGLTATYNRFHDPEERDPRIARLRELHAAMDGAVLEAYGWGDLRPTCEFLLDYEEEESEEEESGRRRKKKPWRYRWPDTVRDEVLARLLALNQERAQAERLSGSAAEAAASKPKPRARRKKAPPSPTLSMFSEEEEG